MSCQPRLFGGNYVEATGRTATNGALCDRTRLFVATTLKGRDGARESRRAAVAFAPPGVTTLERVGVDHRQTAGIVALAPAG
jgi:hypothetical protein